MSHKPAIWCTACELWPLIHFLILATVLGKYLLFQPPMRKSKECRKRAKGYTTSLRSKLGMTLNHGEEKPLFWVTCQVLGWAVYSVHCNPFCPPNITRASSLPFCRWGSWSPWRWSFQSWCTMHIWEWEKGKSTQCNFLAISFLWIMWFCVKFWNKSDFTSSSKVEVLVSLIKCFLQTDPIPGSPWALGCVDSAGRAFGAVPLTI